jgi:CHAT domain-containing protein
LIEDFVLTTSQSPTVFLHSSEEALAKTNVKQERLLSVGNPRFDQTAFSQLDDLPNAKQEAVDIAKLYKVLPLLESHATPAAVKDQMLKSDVVHLAMHSVLDGELPSYSKLLLARGDLPAYDIYGMKLPRTRLVVLSSCQSGAERYFDGEGMASLARAFLSAGVPLVVASLWPVDSEATEKLMVSFHRERVNGSATAEALAKAQREMLQDPENRFRSPFYWAAFALNGGYARF